MGDLSDMQKRIAGFRDARSWKQFHNAKDLAIALNLEATEVLEHFLWKTNDESIEYLKTHRDNVAEELADTLYCVLLMADHLEIDLIKTFDKKMAKNEVKYAVEKAKGNHKRYTELEKE
jgi:dCTP diphosphatase